MLRSAASKVMWVGRATVFLVGLAVTLALLFGVVSTAFAHKGDKGFFHLGHKNVAQKVSTLVRQGAGPALNLQVESGPPLKVNSSKKVASLNSDQIDGKDSSAFMTSKAYFKQQTVTIPANTTHPAIGSCDQGDVAISGGWAGLDATTSVAGSHRHSFEDVWVYTFRRTGDSSDSVTLRLICADLPPLRP